MKKIIIKLSLLTIGSAILALTSCSSSTGVSSPFGSGCGWN